jgi:hypothetical protein
VRRGNAGSATEGGTMVNGVFGGLEIWFFIGWVATVSIRHFVYGEPVYRPR